MPKLGRKAAGLRETVNLEGTFSLKEFQKSVKKIKKKWELISSTDMHDEKIVFPVPRGIVYTSKYATTVDEVLAEFEKLIDIPDEYKKLFRSKNRDGRTYIIPLMFAIYCANAFPEDLKNALKDYYKLWNEINNRYIIDSRIEV